MTTPTHSHKAWTDKGGHVRATPQRSKGRQLGDEKAKDNENTSVQRDIISGKRHTPQERTAQMGGKMLKLHLGSKEFFQIISFSRLVLSSAKGMACKRTRTDINT